MPVSTSIGQRFTQLIQQLGMSKNAFAQSLDKTATVIQHLVDERNKPGYDLLCKVFEVYPNVSKDWLLLGQGPMLTAENAAAELASPASAPVPTPTTEPDLFAAPVPAPIPPSPRAVPAEAPAPAPAVVVAAPSAGAAPAASPAPAPMPSPAPVAAPDPAYLAVALQTQHLQHQLALAEQRNQHLLEQQALMQQLVAVLQRSV
ncbi:helix-turn-helix transcriptional regulator [Siccationidurans ginsengisoli]|nr:MULTISPECIES: helix-turn-helix domain-containing protein [unclassified Hymenobacter]MBO2030904.1 helix-turn-helix transcriptional regulator [Hymenobacter sp. BT559]